MSTEKHTHPDDFEELYVSYFSRMKNFAREYVLSEADAENIVQDIFTELWERKEPLTCGTNRVALLFTSVRNRCIDHLRHQVVVQEAMSRMHEEYRLTLRVKLASLELFDQTLLSEQDIEKIATRIIGSLPEKCRVIFIKSKIEGRKRKEIAAEMNLSLKTVENQLSIAYKKLRTELKDYLPLLLFLLDN